MVQKKSKYNFIEYRLGLKQIALLQDNNVAFMDGLVTCDSIRGLMHRIYTAFVARKLINPIEQMEIKEKEDLWMLTKEISSDRLDTGESVKLSRILYCMEFLLNEV